MFDYISKWEKAREHASRTVNSAHTCACWLTGFHLVESEQGGFSRGAYGAGVLKQVSERLIAKYGSGFSVSGLQYMRAFYLEYPEFLPIQHALRVKSDTNIDVTAILAPYSESPAESGDGAKQHAARVKSWRPGIMSLDLGWTHYRTLIKVKRREIRDFYEIEAQKNHWSARQLERQVNSLLFERLLKSRDKKGVKALANKGLEPNSPIDTIKEPYVLEFLNLPEAHQLVESKVEEALVTRLKDFLLELGSGFAFIGRQQRLTLDGDHFYSDLIFYHVKLKCYMVIDLKTSRLTHGDLGQMQMYVNYYDREVRGEDDNPTIGLILCTDKNDAMVKYVLDDKAKQIFASSYRFTLPTVEELKRELKYEMGQLGLPAPAAKKSRNRELN
jgi:predicted nuclease of restriction endonuclease-like (RecB) superfamily